MSKTRRINGVKHHISKLIAGCARHSSSELGSALTCTTIKQLIKRVMKIKALKISTVLFTVIVAVAINAIIGATFAVLLGFTAWKGAAIANLVAMFLLPLLPKNVARAGVLTEVWTGEMIKAFRTPPTAVGWYDRVRSYDQYVNQDVIHFTELGGDPNVLVNNKTYPLNITKLEDADKAVSLDYFDTEATPVTDDELHAVSYPKMESVLERHREALKEKTWAKAIHAYAPDGNKASKTPVLTTTGEAVDGRNRMVVADLVALKAQFDKMGVPQDGRILVLCPDHSNDLLLTSKNYAEHYNINDTEGKITRLYGFDIYEYGKTPYFNATTLNKIQFDKAPAATDMQASVAFHAGSMMKANGSVQFYHQDAVNDPLHHRSLVNFRKWNLALPLKSNCTRAAIVSAKAS